MKRDENVGTTGASGRDTAVATRTLYPIVTRHLAPPPAVARVTDPGWIEADPDGWEALISVWWDHPPSEDV